MIEAIDIFCKAVREDGRMSRTVFHVKCIPSWSRQLMHVQLLPVPVRSASLRQEQVVPAQMAADAPAINLALAKEIGKYKDLDSDVGQAACAALSRHTWYLCPELVPLAFASKKLNSQALAAIACALVVCSRKEDISHEKTVLLILPSSCTAFQKMTGLYHLSCILGPLQ
jgi:hypothetical protein